MADDDGDGGVEDPERREDFRAVVGIEGTADAVGCYDRDVVSDCEVDDCVGLGGCAVDEVVVGDSEGGGGVEVEALGCHGLEFGHLVLDRPVVGQWVDCEGEVDSGAAVDVGLEDGVGCVVGP